MWLGTYQSSMSQWPSPSQTASRSEDHAIWSFFWGRVTEYRRDYRSPDDLTLIIDEDETSYHLILDTKESKCQDLRLRHYH